MKGDVSPPFLCGLDLQLFASLHICDCLMIVEAAGLQFSKGLMESQLLDWREEMYEEHCQGALEQGTEPPNAQSTCPGQFTHSSMTACACVLCMY